MKSIATPARIVAVLALLMHPLAAADGLLLVEKTTAAGATNTHQIQIEQHRMRVESDGPDGTLQAFVFDGTAQVLRTIDYGRKSYTEMTKADVDRMSGQMAGAMAQIQEQLKNMPPAQRAQMEAQIQAMARGRGVAAPATTTEYRRNGTDKVGKWTCDKYDGYQGGQKTSEVCTVDPSALGFNASDFAVTQQIRDFFKKMMPQNADQIFSFGGNDPQGFRGVPVRRVYTAGQNKTVSEITEVSHQAFADSTFAVPAGFAKRTMGPAGR